jgi:hypothetical protein
VIRQIQFVPLGFDQVLKSISRLFIIPYFMMAMTYLLHSAVAVWLLGVQQYLRQGYHNQHRPRSGNQRRVTSPEKKGPALAPDPDAFKDIDDASTRKKATINDTSDNGLFDVAELAWGDTEQVVG